MVRLDHSKVQQYGVVAGESVFHLLIPQYGVVAGESVWTGQQFLQNSEILKMETEERWSRAVHLLQKRRERPVCYNYFSHSGSIWNYRSRIIKRFTFKGVSNSERLLVQHWVQMNLQKDMDLQLSDSLLHTIVYCGTVSGESTWISWAVTTPTGKTWYHTILYHGLLYIRGNLPFLLDQLVSVLALNQRHIQCDVNTGGISLHYTREEVFVEQRGRSDALCKLAAQ